MFVMFGLAGGGWIRSHARGEKGNDMLRDCAPHFVDSVDIVICETAFELVGVYWNVVLTVPATTRCHGPEPGA